MSHLIETYIEHLLQDPHSLPPQGMDAETAAFVRALVASRDKPSAAQRARIWRRSLDAAKTADHAHSQTTTFHPSSNGSQVHASPTYGEKPMTTISIPASRQHERGTSTRLMGILPLAAAIAFVVLGIALLSSIATTTQPLTAPQGDESQGSLLGARTPTPTVSRTTPADDDADRLSNAREAELRTEPNDSDTDGDGITDGDEVLTWGTDPTKADTDGDTLDDWREVNETGTNPLTTDEAPFVTPTAAPIEVGVYSIQSGDTVLDILTRYDMTLGTLAELNPQIDASGCDFSRLTGGMNCAFALLTVGDEINVPAFDVMPVEAASTALPRTVIPPRDTATSTPFPRSDSAQPPTPLPTSTPIG